VDCLLCSRNIAVADHGHNPARNSRGKHQVNQQIEKVEKLRRKVENSERKKNRDKEPSNNSDNSVSDRL
jgi:hypothetical protein